MSDADETLFRGKIRHLLLTEWDPLDASQLEAAHGAYDNLIDPIVALLAGGAGPDELIKFLHEHELESMCFPSLGTRRLLPVARKLAALKSTEPR